MNSKHLTDSDFRRLALELKETHQFSDVEYDQWREVIIVKPILDEYGTSGYWHEIDEAMGLIGDYLFTHGYEDFTLRAIIERDGSIRDSQRVYANDNIYITVEIGD